MSKLPYGSLICYTGTGSDIFCSNQGRCRVFESGPADETIECRKIEIWESTKRPPLVGSVCEISPEKKES